MKRFLVTQNLLCSVIGPPRATRPTRNVLFIDLTTFVGQVLGLIIYHQLPHPILSPSSSVLSFTAANLPRQDFALFLRLEIVGSSGGFSTRSPDNFVEIAVRGTALPIGLQVRYIMRVFYLDTLFF